MPTLHLMIGLPCSGKTTYAIALARRARALRFTPDEWQIRLFGDDAYDPAHGDRHDAIEAIQWDLAREALLLGVDVVIDFGLWPRVHRDEFAARADALGVAVKWHYMDVPLPTLLTRLDARNAARPRGAFWISRDSLIAYAALFQAPDEAERARGDWVVVRG